MRKGQAAMEFLMTYGWAILVVLIAIGALAYFGVLSPEKFLPEKCVIASGSGLYCDDFTILSDGSVKVRIHNILTQQVTAVVVTLTNDDGTTCNSGAGTSIPADGTTDFTLACGLTDKVKADLAIAYTKNDFVKATSGSLVGRVP